MKRLLLLDEHDYPGLTREIVRTTARGIIFEDDKLILIQSKFGAVKFPGGGLENDENDIEGLKREIKEELGRNIIEESVKEFGYIEEKRKANYDEAIFHQYSRLYFCKVTDERSPIHMTKKEKRYGMHIVYKTIDQAVKINKNVYYREKKENHIWNLREYKIMLILRDYLEQEKQLERKQRRKNISKNENSVLKMNQNMKQ